MCFACYELNMDYETTNTTYRAPSYVHAFALAEAASPSITKQGCRRVS